MKKEKQQRKYEVEDLVQAMLSEYDVDEQTARSGAEGFVNKLQEHGFLEAE